MCLFLSVPGALAAAHPDQPVGRPRNDIKFSLDYAFFEEVQKCKA